VEPVDDAEPGRRDAELAGVGGEPEVAGQRHRHRPAHAEAVDHRHRRLRAGLQGSVGALGALVVGLGRRAVLPLLLELRDVGAGGEGLLAGAPDDDAPHRRVADEPLDDLRERRPHGEIERVPDVGPVEDDGGDVITAFDQDLVAHENPDL